MIEDTYIFNIQHYSLHDGPGIRTIVFLKGCPMRCKWCCNPESQMFYPEISYVENKCIGSKECGWCVDVCQEKAITFSVEGKAVLLRDRCSGCLICSEHCPSRALKTEGRKYGISELLDIVEKDEVFYGHGNGGLTVSGGEPLAHTAFLTELLQKARKRRIHTAIETCGNAEYESLFETAKYLDFILFDIKSMDSKKHREYTGCGNEKILENFTRLCADYPMLRKKVRTPVIPGFNDTGSEIKKIREFLLDKQNVEYEILPYHSFGRGKYKALGRDYPMGDEKLSDETLERIDKVMHKIYNQCILTY